MKILKKLNKMISQNNVKSQIHQQFKSRKVYVPWQRSKRKVSPWRVAELRLLCLLPFCWAAELRFGNMATYILRARASTIANFQV
jgi:hypothetical protein